MLDSFAYWTLTDFIEETQPSSNVFHGGLGLFTYNGIKKPHYYALQYIARLGNEMIDCGDGYFITKSHGCIQVMLYNYQHFNHLFASGEQFDMSFTKRYTPFSTMGLLDITIEFVELPTVVCTIRERYINQKSGSAFDEWVRMGGLPLTEADSMYLRAVTEPKLTVHIANITNGRLVLSASLEPLEVRFIEIQFQ